MKTDTPKIERAIVASVNISSNNKFSYELSELINLIETCNIEVVETFFQNLSRINNKSYMGSGKIKELKVLVNTLDVDLVVFNDELTPIQIKYLEDILDVEILDRTMLILNIFKIGANSVISSLQIELATAKYTLPRLIGKHANLSRISGGGKGGFSNRGAGETKLETDRRSIGRKILKIKSELLKQVASRKQTRKYRSSTGIKTVAIVGYTNAGKSSLLNAILQRSVTKDKKEVMVKDQLFATLETSTRNVTLPNHHEFLITDTVGFISKLPHRLVESFKSTLEEISEADLILHVVDSSSPYLTEQIETTNKVLKELNASMVPTLFVFNKTDKVNNLSLLVTSYKPDLITSVVDDKGIDEVVKKIDDVFYGDIIQRHMFIPYTDGQDYSKIMDNTRVIKTKYVEKGILLTAQFSVPLYNKYKNYVIENPTDYDEDYLE